MILGIVDPINPIPVIEIWSSLAVMIYSCLLYGLMSANCWLMEVIWLDAQESMNQEEILDIDRKEKAV